MTVAKLLAATALVPLALSSIPVRAQTAGATATNTTSTNADPAAAPATDTATGDIVVTGSRIRRPNLQSTVPVTSIQG